MAQMSAIRTAASESIAEMLENVYSESTGAAGTEPAAETTVASRARHRQVTFGMPLTSEPRAEEELTHQWITTHNPDWAEENDPWLTSTSNPSHGYDDKWRCHVCNHPNELYHQWCSQCWARRIG